MIVTRFAPSPTGALHIGGARTALFSWLLARHSGGKFLLRIEDTDRERSTEENTKQILDSILWLGLDWDEKPIKQSMRYDVYNAQVERLLEEDKAYYCSCSPEEVEAMREEARAKGLKPKYNGKCRELDLGPAPNHVVRFKTPQTGKTVYEDMVKGTVAWDNSELDDMIIRRTDGWPTYNLAVVCDDHDQGVTHVLRGDDHVNNTPRQILLYEALGYELPKFGHVPMILGPDKKKLSKRHGARSVLEYELDGMLPEALINYLARLGWSCGDQEIFSTQELVEKFSTEHLNKSAAAFDPDKLLWLNSQHLKEASDDRLASLLAGQLALLGIGGSDASCISYLKKIIPLYKPRAKTIREMAEAASFFVLPDRELAYDNKAVSKFLTEEVKPHLKALAEKFKALETFDQPSLEAVVQAYLDETGLKFKVLAQPLRVALTGGTVSPGLFETMEVLGQDSTLTRLHRALGLMRGE